MFIAIVNAIGRSGGYRTDGLTPSNTIAPVISGTASVGNVLTSTTGTWNSDTGVIGYLYQWTRDGVDISGATSSTYTLVTADLTKTILCKVAATDLDGTSAYVNSNSLIIYDSNYLTVINYATTQGYTLPSLSQRIKQSNLLTDLKTAGVWNKLDTFANFATDGDSNFALIDWKRLSLLTAVNSPSFTTNEGFMGNGTSSYIDTNFNPSTQSTNYVTNNASRYMYLFSGTTAQRIDGNSIDTNNIRLGSYNNQKINSGSVNLMNSAFNYTTTKGMKSIHRTSSTAITLYNASVGENRTLLSTGLPNATQWVLRQGGIYVNAKMSMYAMGASMVTENTDFVNAFDTYLNSL